MKRREFITLLGGAAVWPIAAHAQEPAMPPVGFLRNTAAGPFAHLVTELSKGLSEEGFVEGRNVIIEQRWGDNQPDRLPSLAADLVRRKAAVIVGNTPAVIAAVRVAGPTVPLVFCGRTRAPLRGTDSPPAAPSPPARSRSPAARPFLRSACCGAGN